MIGPTRYPVFLPVPGSPDSWGAIIPRHGRQRAQTGLCLRSSGFPSDAAPNDSTPSQLTLWYSVCGVHPPEPNDLLLRGRSVNPDRLSIHLQTYRYGEFRLTEAIRPAPEVPLRSARGIPGRCLPRPACTRAHSDALGGRVRGAFVRHLPGADRTPGRSRGRRDREQPRVRIDHHIDLRRDHIDRAVLASHLCDFEELLTHDGCTGIAVMAAGRPVEVQFDEHKLFHVYAPELAPFRRILRDAGVRRRRVLPLICEAEHLHHTTEDFANPVPPTGPATRRRRLRSRVE